MRDPLAVAIRVFREELGHDPPNASSHPLGEIRQPGGKRVAVWAVEASQRHRSAGAA